MLREFKEASHALGKKFQRVVHLINDLYQKEVCGIDVLLP